jgi:hypothetical protein
MLWFPENVPPVSFFSNGMMCNISENNITIVLFTQISETTMKKGVAIFIFEIFLKLYFMNFKFSE